MRSSRSLSRAAAFTLALLPAAWLSLPRSHAAAAETRGRLAPVATLLTIDKTAVGRLRAAAGGNVVGTVMAQAPGSDGTLKKHVTSLSYEEIELELNLSLDRSVYDWINAAWSGQAPRKSGALTLLDFNGKAKSTREFHNARISEVVLPPLDAASREAGFFTLVLTPEQVRSVPSTGAKATEGPLEKKSWLNGNFKLEIDGLDTSKVTRIEGLRFRQRTSSGTDAARAYGKDAGAIELGNLRVTVAEAGADAWRKWHEELVVKGKTGDENERSGRVRLLAPNLKDELARIELSNLGIVALRPQVNAAGQGQVEAELYVERMRFTLGGK